MIIYFDTSGLVPLYLPERGSVAARRHAAHAGQIPYTQLHALELTNAMQLSRGRAVITATELRAVTLQIEEDIQAHRLRETFLDLNDVFRSARELAQRHSIPLLCRSLDVLHVAAALHLRCRQFVSADARQLDLARAVGLATVGLGAQPRTTRRPRS